MEEEKPVRIQKVIADRGLASRREAERWISEGRVRINGTPAVIGQTCFPSRDQIQVDDSPLPRREPPKMVLAMNKPKGFLCTNDDPHVSRTVFDLLTPEFAAYRLFCVGRLDKESEGLILLTNDGKLKQKLTHPSYNVAKKYSVELDKPLQEKALPKLIRGIQWEGERLSLDRVLPLKGRGKETGKLLEVTLHHGRKREIRRLFYAFGYDVRKLRREQIGRFQLKGLPRGTFRTLSTSEIRQLFQAPAAARSS